MKAAAHNIIETLTRVYPSPWYLLFTAAALIFLIVRRDHMKEKLLALYSLLIFFSFLLPPVAWVMGKVMRDGDVYWRYLWLLPTVVLIGSACTELTSLMKTKWMKAGCALILMAALVFGGKTIYSKSVFGTAISREKLPQMTMVCVREIEANIERTGNTYAKLAAPQSVIGEIRQVTSSVITFGSRVTDFEKQKKGTSWERNLMILNRIWKDEKRRFAKSMWKQHVNYVVLYDGYVLEEDMVSYGFEPIYSQDNWKIWYNPELKKKETS